MAGRRKRKRGGTVVYVLIILILLLFIAGVVFYSRFGFSKEMADLNDYYSLTADDQVGVVIDNSVMGAKGIVISDAPYLDYDVVSDYISSRFYVDKEEGLLLYAMPTELIRIKADEKTYKIAGEEVTEDIPISKLYTTEFTADDGKTLMVRKGLHLGEIHLYVPAE